MTDMTNTTTDHLFHNDHVAGGWTEHDTVARRICTALWHATETFKRIEHYEADVVIDYTIILNFIAEMEPHCEVHLAYVVGTNGTRLTEVDYNRSDPYEVFYDDDRGGNTGRYKVAISRSGYRTDEFARQWGADKYSLTIDHMDAARAAL